MTQITKTTHADDNLQWAGAFFIALGHVLNTIGVDAHHDFWNIVAFAIGTICFFMWAWREHNRPQVAVNIASLAVITVGIAKGVM